MSEIHPGIVIAGIGGDSGKTLVSCGIARALVNSGRKVAAFKKGPDYIDSSWLSMASRNQCRNLDTFMIGRDKSLKIYQGNIANSDISIIEGNRGLYDGLDAGGTHSTAELAKLLGLPVVLIVNCTKVTRTAAAIVLGCKILDSSLKISGVILNNVAGSRHSKVIEEAVESITGIPVIGSVIRVSDEIIPSRHLGLITPAEFDIAESAIAKAAEMMNESVKFEKIITIANTTEPFEKLTISFVNSEKKARIGYFYDKAFSFYYPENLEALNSAGAELIPVSAIDDNSLGEIDGLYIGGGFPETNASVLSANKQLRENVRRAAISGMPVYAECGGLMYLSRGVRLGSRFYEMAGVFDFDVVMSDKPQGHGYAEAKVIKDNPYFRKGEILRGHEFHYSYIDRDINNNNLCLELTRGMGSSNRLDGIMLKNTFASYMHIHAHSAETWSESFVQASCNYKNDFK